MAENKNIGDEVTLVGPSGFVGLPDGSVVSCGHVYTFTHEGEHRIEDEVYNVGGADLATDADGDEYDAMSYSDLQSVAKARDINAGGSAEDLRERLRAFDEEE